MNRNELEKELGKQPGAKKKKEPSIIEFLVGVLLLGAGLFLLSQKVSVFTMWGAWGLGAVGLPTGLIFVPLIIGVIWRFAVPTSKVSVLVIVLSVVFIVMTVIMSVRVSLSRISMFDFVLILVMSAAGAGLLLKTLFQSRD